MAVICVRKHVYFYGTRGGSCSPEMHGAELDNVTSVIGLWTKELYEMRRFGMPSSTEPLVRWSSKIGGLNHLQIAWPSAGAH